MEEALKLNSMFQDRALVSCFNMFLLLDHLCGTHVNRYTKSHAMFHAFALELMLVTRKSNKNNHMTSEYLNSEKFLCCSNYCEMLSLTSIFSVLSILASSKLALSCEASIGVHIEPDTT